MRHSSNKEQHNAIADGLASARSYCHARSASVSRLITNSSTHINMTVNAFPASKIDQPIGGFHGFRATKWKGDGGNPA